MKPLDKMKEEELEEFIRQHLPIRLAEKKKFGEVFTNPVLIHKMLDLFPARLWSDPQWTWCDPSAGAGFFMIFIYLRLLTGLAKWEPRRAVRSKHIISKMLVMVELNPDNCRLCRQLFGKHAVIHCGDFLELHDLKQAPFGSIVGNPPFQGNNVHEGKSKLYERIFLKASNPDWLRSGGYLSFLTPDNLFSGNGSASYQRLLENHVSWVSFHPSNEASFQSIQQPMCYFLMEKTGGKEEEGEGKGEGKKEEEKRKTRIECNDHVSFTLSLPNRPVNPVRNWTPATERLIRRWVSNERNAVHYCRGKSVSSYRGTKYPIVYTPTKRLATEKRELAVGWGIKKAILFSISPDMAFHMDYSGRVGAGPNTFYIPFHTRAEGECLEQFLNSDDYLALSLATKTSRHYLKIALITHLDLDKIMNQTKTTKINKTRKKRTRKTQPTNKTRKAVV